MPDRRRLVRRAGTGRLADGATVVWSVAEGRQGRRWREVVVDDGGHVTSSLLLETDPARRFSHLELATAAGLLTLHPEGDGTLHGNTVLDREPGVSHVLGLPWRADDALAIEGSPVASAAIVWAALADPGADPVIERAGMSIDRSLAIAPRAIRLQRLELGRWRIGSDAPLDVDDDGLPALAGGRTWPLELDAPLDDV